jgi:hypothetical protein
MSFVFCGSIMVTLEQTRSQVLIYTRIFVFNCPLSNTIFIVSSFLFSYADGTFHTEEPTDLLTAVCADKYLHNDTASEKLNSKCVTLHPVKGNLPGHRKHENFSIQDIRGLDSELAGQIVDDALKYGYTKI